MGSSTAVESDRQNSQITLHGITWDHPRAVDSIHQASEAYSSLHPGIEIDWTARPLHAFEEMPIELLAEKFDIMAIDHPFVGDGVEKSALAPLTSLVPSSRLVECKNSFMGRSFESYVWNEELYAMPVDAACMVSAASSNEIFSTDDPPITWQQALETMYELGRERVLLTANPTHLWGTFLSLCEAHSPGPQSDFVSGPTWWHEDGIASNVGLPALEALRELAALSSPRSLQMDPVQVLDELSGGGPGVYCPSVFIYSTYSLKRSDRRLVTFHDAPRLGDSPVGTLTGGVGLGVSSQSQHGDKAADFVLFATSHNVQRGLYTEAGGQPATIDAWSDDAVNARVADLYRNTAATMSRSFIRPRRVGYPQYQRTASRALHNMFTEGTRSETVLRTLNRMWLDVVTL
ncbi:extracellular solute-binding protein [Brevibacterium renqingii]|uniref:extracellular solute-binding protein n=1 Tax=Brevibacterium renqingii TaxID=2776916 RepID=UPI001AE077EC|nr:extracellular solute-binding protein [Brevibacterium renqingii]